MDTRFAENTANITKLVMDIDTRIAEKAENISENSANIARLDEIKIGKATVRIFKPAFFHFMIYADLGPTSVLVSNLLCLFHNHFTMNPLQLFHTKCQFS